MKIKKIETAILNTPLGLAELQGSEQGISQLKLLKEQSTVSAKIPDVLKPAALQLKEYFKGSRKNFNLKLNPAGTQFQQKVWKALLEVPYGTTLSYLQLSLHLGDVKAIRAVASANGKNPLWIIIPCHRIIGSNGSLTGYAGGIATKKWLLDHENPPKQQSLFN